jgi:3-oxoacyl-[acyl-carrier protein] reductase
VQKLSKNGWNVVINYSKSKQEAEETEKICQLAGAETLLIQADVSDDAACRKLVAKGVEKWGRVDALVNNAGTTRFCSFLDLDGLTKQDFMDIYEVNVVGAYQMTRAAVPFLKKAKDGVIVNTSSISAISGVGSSIAYAASKGALSTMTKSLAHALAPDIRVNAVCPGFIQGRWTKNFLGDQYHRIKQNIEKTTLLNQTSVPDDIADCILFLIENARMISGEIITVDGGQLVNQSTLD